MENINEVDVEKNTRDYLLNAGWKLTNLPKLIGIHGCDITAWNPRHRKVYYIEVKGDLKHRNQSIHNAFNEVIGQIISRMDIEGNQVNKARYYAIAIPSTWEEVFHALISVPNACI